MHLSGAGLPGCLSGRAEEDRLRLLAGLGLRGYWVGRYLRFRERHVEEWLQSREV